MKGHPSWPSLMARPLAPAVAAHVQACPQCRIDRRRLLVEVPQPMPASAYHAFDDAQAAIVRALLPSARTTMSRLSRSGDDTPLPTPGTAFGPYRAVGVLGRGETSVVLLAVHERHGTRHALKVVRTLDPAVLRQVRREHRMQDELHHPHLLPVVDSVDAPTGQAVLVLEFVDGPTLARLLWSRATLPWPWIDAIAIDVLRGVDALHEAGFVHRDLNPSNVLLDPNPRFRARVGDFGQAALRGSPDHATRVGPPVHLAPEQLGPAGRSDARSDVFALGSLLYELVTHQACFGGVDDDDVERRLRAVEYLPVRQLRPEAPARIVQAIEAALVADPEARPARASELLELWTRGAGDAARPPLELSGAELAALRSMRGIERLPDATSALTPAPLPDPTGRIAALTQAERDARAHVRPRLPAPLRRGRWAALIGATVLAAIVGAATWSSRQPTPEPTPTEIRIDRGRVGLVDPHLSQDHRRLVFSDQRDLWVGALDGTSPRLLTGAFAPAATQPAWSRDQRRLAFTGPDGIYIIDLLRNDDPVPVVPHARDPAWSPDGSRIGFVARRHGDQPVALRVWDRWTQEIVTLLEEPGLGRPTFSPSGERIALETGAGLAVIAVSVDDEGRMQFDGRASLSIGDTAPRFLDDDTIVAFRAHPGVAHGGALVVWRRTDEGWEDEALVTTTRDIRSVEVGRDARYFVVGLTDPVPTVFRVDRNDPAAPAPVRVGRGPAVSEEGLVAMQGSDGRLVRRDRSGDWGPALRDPAVAVDDWSLRPDGDLLVRVRPETESPAWFVVRDGELEAAPELESVPIVGPLAWSADGRHVAGRFADRRRPLVLNLTEPIEAQITTALEAPWPGRAVMDLSPSGDWLLVDDRSGVRLVDRWSGQVVGPPFEVRAATFVDDDTIAGVEPAALVLFDRTTRDERERYPTHPYTLPLAPTIGVNDRSIYVDGLEERGGLLRIDRLTGRPIR